VALLIKIKHPKFRSIELRDGSLVIHSMQGKARVLQESVDDFAVVVQAELIHIVGFVKQTYAWFFRGTDDFRSERIELGQAYGGGGRLVSDGAGNSHLFYFVKQAVGHGVQLRHQTFTDSWSVPQTVSINVFAEHSSYGSAWHEDGYLHLVYCGHADQQLFYRVYDLDRRLWSGAVMFSEERCSHPQFIQATGRLYLFWQEDRSKNTLQVRYKEGDWSGVKQVSSGEGHVSNVGYSLEDGQWMVYWGEESRFYEASFGSWSDRTIVKREDYNYAWVVEGQQTIAVYESKIELPKAVADPEVPQQVQAEIQTAEPEPEPTPEPKPEPTQTSPAEARDKAEERLQAAFIEQAFRAMQEWEKVRDEMGRWQREFRLPEPVDLTPLVTRIERLERRLLSLQQSQEQRGKVGEESFNQLEQGLARTRMRLEALEDAKQTRPLRLWERVLRRG
jgi:hypothetical protein